jgi:hypothetical protein
MECEQGSKTPVKLLLRAMQLDVRLDDQLGLLIQLVIRRA